MCVRACVRVHVHQGFPYLAVITTIDNQTTVCDAHEGISCVSEGISCVMLTRVFHVSVRVFHV
jgi:hypothetical protein